MIKDKRKILILILGIILIYLDISFIIRRQIISLNRINSKIKTLKQHQLIISKEKDLKDRLEDLRGQFHSLKKRLYLKKKFQT